MNSCCVMYKAILFCFFKFKADIKSSDKRTANQDGVFFTASKVLQSPSCDFPIGWWSQFFTTVFIQVHSKTDVAYSSVYSTCKFIPANYTYCGAAYRYCMCSLYGMIIFCKMHQNKKACEIGRNNYLWPCFLSFYTLSTPHKTIDILHIRERNYILWLI